MSLKALHLILIAFAIPVLLACATWALINAAQAVALHLALSLGALLLAALLLWHARRFVNRLKDVPWL